MDLKEKIEKFIRYCSSISEFDKYFWISKLDEFDNETLYKIYTTLLRFESKLLDFELNSIGKIKALITDTYPELESKYLPDFQSIYEDFKTVQNELTIDRIQSLRARIQNRLV
jgi:hypothetical protein